MFLGDSAPRLIFHTVPEDAVVSIVAENEDPAGTVKLYTYKPSTRIPFYNAEVSPQKEGTRVLQNLHCQSF